MKFKFVIPAFLALSIGAFAAEAPPASPFPPKDPLVAIDQDWQAMTIQQGHLLDTLRDLVGAYRTVVAQRDAAQAELAKMKSDAAKASPPEPAK